MFADCLLDSQWAKRSHRGWTALAALALQSFGVTAVVMLPLIYNQGLPKLHLLANAPIGPPPGPPPGGQHRAAIRPIESNIFHGIVVAPPTTPIGMTRFVDDSPGQEAPPCSICVPGSTGRGTNANPMPGFIGTTAAPVPPPPPTPAAHQPRISHVMEGNLVYRVQPIYPPLARAARVQGSVVLRAIISRRGTIENLQAISGHPMLVGAAVDAVRQWRYRPYILNGDPVEVETQVTVIFSLSGG